MPILKGTTYTSVAQKLKGMGFSKEASICDIVQQLTDDNSYDPSNLPHKYINVSSVVRDKVEKHQSCQSVPAAVQPHPSSSGITDDILTALLNHDTQAIQSQYELLLHAPQRTEQDTTVLKYALLHLHSPKRDELITAKNIDEVQSIADNHLYTLINQAGDTAAYNKAVDFLNNLKTITIASTIGNGISLPVVGAWSVIEYMAYQEADKYLTKDEQIQMSYAQTYLRFYPQGIHSDEVRTITHRLSDKHMNGIIKDAHSTIESLLQEDNHTKAAEVRDTTLHRLGKLSSLYQSNTQSIDDFAKISGTAIELVEQGNFEIASDIDHTKPTLTTVENGNLKAQYENAKSTLEDITLKRELSYMTKGFDTFDFARFMAFAAANDANMILDAATIAGSNYALNRFSGNGPLTVEEREYLNAGHLLVRYHQDTMSAEERDKVRVEMGEVLRERGRFHSAYKVHDQIESQDLKNQQVELTQNSVHDAMYQRTMDLAESQPDAAIPVIRNLIDIDERRDTQIDARIKLAELYRDLGFYHEQKQVVAELKQYDMGFNIFRRLRMSNLTPSQDL